MEKSWVRSNDKKKVSSDDTSSMPDTMYRKWREQKDTRMKKENCNNDDNNWHFHANLSLEVLPVQDGDSACIGNVQKPR